jgi:hypothetical protein
MPDLIDKYFKADLTEAEQEALSQSLLTSDEAMLKFEQKAKEAYQSFGLPEPQPHWPDTPPPSAPAAAGLGGLPWMSIILTLGLSALIAWRYFCVCHNAAMAPPPQTVVSSLTQGSGTVPAVKPARSETSTELSEKSENDGESQEFNPSTKKESSSAESSALASSVTPVNLEIDPSRAYSNLSVEIDQTQLGFLAVRVLSPQGVEMKTLFKGSLNSGRWVFEWDGKLANGQPAPAGDYQIEVRSGTFVQHKNIQIL